MSDAPFLEVRGLCRSFDVIRGVAHRKLGSIKAVDDVSFSIGRGEILGLVGESGCGKTTVGRCILRAIEPTSGSVLLHGGDGGVVDVTALDREGLKRARQQIRMIFQDPYSSLNPRMNVLEIVSRPLIANRLEMNAGERKRRVADILSEVGLDEKYMRRYPHAFSGGQRQRIAIARALVVEPRLVIADEPVSALDVSIQAQILNLLKRLKGEHGLTYLFIAHNLAVINHLCDRVAVMYLGRIVELGITEELFARPRHPYTEALLAAVPVPDPRIRAAQPIVSGEVADLLETPPGCAFHPRCPYAREICSRERPPLADCGVPGGRPRLTACHLAGELTLAGVD
jgi:peptide/nickel transport system ATP-binding protein